FHPQGVTVNARPGDLLWTRLALLALLLAAARPARAEDDTAKFNGKWKGVVPVNGQSLTMQSIHDGNVYKNYVIAPTGAIAAGDGTFSAVEGKWTAVASNGSDSGTYHFLNPDRVFCKDVNGVIVVWERDNTPLPPLVGVPVAPAPAAPANPTPPPPA